MSDNDINYYQEEIIPNNYEENAEEEEFDEELPPEAKEYYEYKNQIDIMEKKKKILLSNLQQAKKNHKIKEDLKKTKERPFKNYNYSEYKEYEKQILNKMIKEELFDEVGTTKDILGSFVDKVLERSLYLYRNRNCHTCSKLLSMGMSTKKCPKCHHLLRELYKQKKDNK